MDAPTPIHSPLWNFNLPKVRHRSIIYRNLRFKPSAWRVFFDWIWRQVCVTCRASHHLPCPLSRSYLTKNKYNVFFFSLRLQLLRQISYFYNVEGRVELYSPCFGKYNFYKLSSNGNLCSNSWWMIWGRFKWGKGVKSGKGFVFLILQSQTK